MGYAEREREQEPRCRTIQSQAERRDRGQTEKSWRLFEGIDTFLYDLMRKSKKMVRIALLLALVGTSSAFVTQSVPRYLSIQRWAAPIQQQVTSDGSDD